MMEFPSREIQMFSRKTVTKSKINETDGQKVDEKVDFL